MSEELKPVVNEETADVAQTAQQIVEEVKEEVVNLAEKTLAELTGLFQELKDSEDRMKRFKEAEAIKSAFYKKLSKEKVAAGEDAAVEEPDENTPAEDATVPMQSGPVSPFAAIEAGFKALYMEYKKVETLLDKELKNLDIDQIWHFQTLIHRYVTPT